MENGMLSEQERKILIGSLVGTIVVLAGLGFGFFYFLTQGTLNGSQWVFVSILIVILIIFVPGIINLFSDLSSKNVLEGQSEITDTGNSFGSPHRQHIRLTAFDKKKIQIQYMDRNKMVVGHTIKYRISPKSRMLLSFEVQGSVK